MPNNTDWLSKISLEEKEEKEEKEENRGKNSTTIFLLTNLNLDIHELKQMNNQINVSIGETIRPFNTDIDNDLLYTCSTMKITFKFELSQKIKFYI